MTTVPKVRIGSEKNSKPISIPSVKKNFTKHFDNVTSEDELIATPPAQHLYNILQQLGACIDAIILRSAIIGWHGGVKDYSNFFIMKNGMMKNIINLRLVY